MEPLAQTPEPPKRKGSPFWAIAGTLVLMIPGLPSPDGRSASTFIVLGVAALSVILSAIAIWQKRLRWLGVMNILFVASGVTLALGLLLACRGGC